MRRMRARGLAPAREGVRRTIPPGEGGKKRKKTKQKKKCCLSREPASAASREKQKDRPIRNVYLSIGTCQ